MKNIDIGDILVSIWGYGQTNVDFFEVTEKSKTGKTVWLRKLDQFSTDEQGKKKKYTYRDGEGFTMPKKGKFVPIHDNETGRCTDETPIKKVVKYNSDGEPFVYMSTARSMISGRTARLWEGKPVRESWYY